MSVLELKGSRNYAAQIVRIPKVVTLERLDNLVGVPVLGGQALVSKGEYSEGNLAIAFGPETQLSHEFVAANSLYRHQELNADPGKAGYLEDNRIIRAIRLRGHKSNVLLMPLSSLYRLMPLGGTPVEGTNFDHVSGVEICRKYEVPVKAGTRGATKIEKAFKRVEEAVFPKHLETDQFARNSHTIPIGRELIVTQKLHGTSARVGFVPVLRAKGRVEKFLNRWLPTATHEYAMVYGSKNSVKDANNPRQAHFYDSDLWTHYGKQLDGILPEGCIVYGELVGFTPEGGAIQKGYTYEAKPREAELYVYRVAFVNEQGFLHDLPWDGVRDFCEQRGLNHVPELHRISRFEDDTDWSGNVTSGLDSLQEWVESQYLNIRFRDYWQKWDDYNHLKSIYSPEQFDDYIDAAWDARREDVWTPADEDEPFVDRPLALSDGKSVDEGVCIRWDSIVPTTLNAKASKFLEYESAQLDKDIIDIESAS